MSITHVATTYVADGLPAGTAAGDVVVAWGIPPIDYIGGAWRPVTDVVGWNLLTVQFSNSGGSVSPFAWWWRRLDGPLNSQPPNGSARVFSAWRGALGVRDVASAARFLAAGTGLTSGQVVAPAVRGGVGDVALVSAWVNLYRQFGGGPTPVLPSGSTPALTVRLADYDDRNNAGSTDRGVFVGSDALASAGTSPAYTLNGLAVGPAGGALWACAAIALCEPIAPLAPTLGEPAPSAVVDQADGITFSWTHNRAGWNGTGSGGQSGYALRRRVGAGAYEYWNASTAAWSGTVAWNAATDSTVAFPAGLWATDTAYAWSVATMEDAGSQQGPFAPDRPLTTRTKPTVTITAPGAVVTTPQPEITWTPTYTSPWEGIAYQASIFPVDQADSPGFDPTTVTPVWTSGPLPGTDTSITPWVPLANGTAYAVMVRVQQTGGQWSDWERTDTLVSLAAPASPHVDAVPSTDPLSGCPVVTVTVSARDNLLSAADASVEVPNTWEAGPNTGITETSDWSADGTQSLKLTATAAGDVSCVLPDPLPVEPDTLYTGTATVHAAATARDVTVTILWEDSTGTSLGSSPSLAVEDDTTGVVVQVTGTAPPNAAGARLQVTITGCASGEVHHADKFGIAPGTGTPWSPGGFTDVTATVEFSDDPLSGVWGTLATVTLDGEAVITDWTAQPGQLRTYRATTNAGTYSSPASEVALAGIDVTDYWLVDVDAQSATPVRLRTDETRTHPRDRGEFAAFDREVSLMRYGTVRSVRGAYTAMTQTGADVDALVDLLNSGHTILVQAPREEGVYPRHLYMAVVDDPTTERVVQAPYAWRVVSWSWRADTPPVGEGYGGTFPAGYAGTL